MTDTVDTLTLFTDFQRHDIRLTNESDGTGESNVVKVDVSGLTGKPGYTIQAVDVERVFGQVGGFNYVTLRWDASTDDEIIVLPPGSFDHDFRGQAGDSGSGRGLINPLSAGSTRDIMLTTDGAFNGASYTITLQTRIRYH